MRPKHYGNCLRARRVKSQVPEMYQGKNGLKKQKLERKGADLLTSLPSSPLFSNPTLLPRALASDQAHLETQTCGNAKDSQGFLGKEEMVCKTGDKKLVLKDF